MREPDQAEYLRIAMREKNEENEERDSDIELYNSTVSDGVYSLPPRGLVHQESKKTKIKLKHPLVTLLVLFFILLILTILCIYFTKDDEKLPELKTSYETIDFKEAEQASSVKEHNETSEQKQIPSLLNSELGEKKMDTKEVLHVVNENETLSSISFQYFGNSEGINVIKEYNQLTSSQLKKGDVLKIPLSN